MATEGLVKRSVASGRTYDSLPDRLKAAVPLSEWNLRVKQHCIHQGLGWKNSIAKSVCYESEYYEELVAFYTRNLRHQRPTEMLVKVFPYHLSDYVCRIMRLTPFKYNVDVLFTVMRAEKSYDSIPNFLAADLLRLAGIGRNEYIATMNKGKAKKLMWRLNASSILRDILPTEPVDVQFQGWWAVHVVNLGEQEFRSLTEDESALCQKACQPEGLKVQHTDQAVLQRLYKMGIVYLSVPVDLKHHVSIPPLEGFVSNKDSEKGEDKGDPMEATLYAMFVACSERTTVAKLADILSAEPAKLQAAVSFACRLGFATCLPPSIEESLHGPSLAEDEHSKEASPEQLSDQSLGSRGSGLALVVDTEVTSYLMMGALSPGLKRHSVSLFEGGRITGSEVMDELIQELDGSVATAAQFEGEMQMLAGYARSLSCILRFLQASAQNRKIEILRKETLSNLDPETAARVLNHGYAALLPITPFPAPPLPLDSTRPGPVDLGFTRASSSPWLQLTFYRLANSSLHSFVLPAGQIFHSLPNQLSDCTHLLVWPWDPDIVRAQGLPLILESKWLLHNLNEHLCCTALLVQPIQSSSPSGELNVVCLPLPLLPPNESGLRTAYDSVTGEAIEVCVPPGIDEAAKKLGIQDSVGCISLIQVEKEQMVEEMSKGDLSTWLVQRLQLGVPLRPDSLCAAVCQEAQKREVLSERGLLSARNAELRIQENLSEILRQAGSVKGADSKDPADPSLSLHLHNNLLEAIDLRTFML